MRGRIQNFILLSLLLFSTALAQNSQIDELRARVAELRNQQKHRQALPLALQALELTESQEGKNSEAAAARLNDIGGIYFALGDYRAAGRYYSSSLKLREQLLGPMHPDTATSLNNVATAYQSLGGYQQALPLLQRALKIWEQVLGPEHVDVATALSNLASLYRATADYDKAKELCERALTIYEKRRGPNHLDTAAALNNLSTVLYTLGNYSAARPLAERALDIRMRVLGPNHALTANSINNLATLELAVGNSQGALTLYRQSLARWEKSFGPEHPSVADILANLSEVYQQLGQFERASALAQRALAITEKNLGAEHPDTARRLKDLGDILVGIGDYQQASRLHQRALALFEKQFGSNHPTVAATLESLAMVHYLEEDFEAAEPLYKRALEIQRGLKGVQHPAVATLLDNLAATYHQSGRLEEAEVAYRDALALRQQTLGKEHEDVAFSLNNLAMLLHDQKKKQEALELEKQAVQIAQRAAPYRPSTGSFLDNLAYLYAVTGELEEGLEMARQAVEVKEKVLGNVLSFTSERQRLAHAATIRSYDVILQVGEFAGIDKVTPLLTRAILRRKGVVLDSLLEDARLAHASKKPELEIAVAQLREKRSTLAKVSETDTKRPELQAEMEKAEGQLARSVRGLGQSRQALSVTVESVQKALPQQAVLVEFVRYRSKFLSGVKEHYGAALILPEGAPRWVPLGEARPLEIAVRRYLRAVRQGRSLQPSQQLYDLVWLPVKQTLPDKTKTVILSPDGPLNFVSFAALVSPQEKFLAEELEVVYVASGRDLLKASTSNSESSVYLLGDANFGSQPEPPSGTQSRARVMKFEPLPGTLRECTRIATLMKDAGYTVESHLKAEATEASLRRAHSPRFVHLATHGFFMHRANRESNPMRRSGLALSGSNDTLRKWSQGLDSQAEQDGILTAEEASCLQLERTRLVTLSACESGQGEARAGEGVLGLRRGFLQAGAESLLLTLWPVADQETAEIMEDFYAQALKSHPARALARVQRDWLVRLRESQGVAEAVRLAGPFVVSFQGSLGD